MVRGAQTQATQAKKTTPPTPRNGDGSPIRSGQIRRRADRASSRSAARRSDEILDAAAEIFSTKGYAGTTTKDIGEAVGIDNSTLYYYVKSKDDLLYQIALRVHEITDRRLEMVEAGGGDEAAKLRQIVTGHLLGFAESLHATRAYYADWHQLQGDRYEDIRSRRARYVAYVRSLVRSGQDNGLFDDRLDPAVVSFGILTMLNSLYLWYDPQGPFRLPDIAENYCNLLLDGISRRNQGPASGTAPSPRATRADPGRGSGRHQTTTRNGRGRRRAADDLP